MLTQTFPGGGAERLREVSLIVGAATNEAVNRALRSPQSVPKDRAAYRALVEQAGQSWSDRLLAAYPAESDQAVPEAVLRYLTDRDFVCASRYVAAKRSSLTWVYLISAMPAPTPAGERLGSFHGADLRFLFNLTHGIPLGDTGRRVGEVMRRFWVRFAANGDPNDGGTPGWPRFQATKPQHLELGDVIQPATGEWLSRCNLFDEIWDARSRNDQ